MAGIRFNRNGGAGIAVAGTPVTNLARNPVPGDGSGLGFAYNSPGSTLSIVGSGGPFGGPFARFTFGSAATAANSDLVVYGDATWVAGSGATIPAAIQVTPGDTHTFSAYVRTSRANPFVPQCQYIAGGGAASGTFAGVLTTPTANTWTRLSVTATAGADAQALRCDVDVSSPVSWLAGDTFDVACVMISRGPTLLPYGGGTTAGWHWSGTANASPSAMYSYL